jgi:hypothetical protein
MGYVYPGTCLECRYFDLECDQEPCLTCKHNVPVNDPSYHTVPEHYFPRWEREDLTNTDAVIHPSHYNQGGIECIDAMVAAFGKEAVATWCKINAFKYIWREEHKNGLQDIDKAIWYLNKYKELKASGE